MLLIDIKKSSLTPKSEMKQQKISEMNEINLVRIHLRKD